MHAYQVTDAQGIEMLLHASDMDGAQERFIDICEREGVQHAAIVRIVRA